MDSMEENLRQRIAARRTRMLAHGDAGASGRTDDAGGNLAGRPAADSRPDAHSGAGYDTDYDAGDSWQSLLAGRNAVMLALVTAGVGLHAFNQFAIVAAMPLAATELGGADIFSWAYSLYFIGSIAGGAGAAAFRDRVGLKVALLSSCMLFLLGGLAAMSAPAFSFILAGRFLQGIADGLIVAIAYSLIPGNFRAGLISKVFAVEAMAWAIAAVLGPLAGGWLAEAFSWRMSFVAVLPFLLLLIVLTPLARPAPSHQSNVVPAPFAIAMLIIGALVLSVSSVVNSGLQQALALGGGALLFVLAVVLDGRVGPRLFPEGAFRVGSVFGCGLWVLLLLSLSHSVAAVYLALSIERLWGYRPTVVGAIVLLMALTWSVVAVIASRNPSNDRQDFRTRMGPLLQMAGLAAIAAGLAWHSIALVIAGQMLIGSGFGLSWANVNRVTLAAAPETDRERAGALLPTVSTAGYAIGAGIAGLVATATDLVGRLENGADDIASLSPVTLPALWLHGLAAIGAGIAWLFARKVRLPR